jgi:Zn ribbon nucleic-acid-binding protein
MERVTAPALNPADAAPSTAALALPVPANLIEFMALYGTEAACLDALIAARWPGGFACPRCAHGKGWRHANRRLIECAACGHQASPTAGTLLHMAKLELHKLFLLLYLLVAEKDGANAKQLQRQVGVNYKTARLWTLKFRDMLHGRERDKLTGRVQIDETIVGGSDGTSIGRRLGEKRNYVLVMVEDKGKSCGRLRLEAIDDASGDMLQTVVESRVAKGSTAHTDGLPSYSGLPEAGIRHKPQVIGDPKQASEKFPKVHRVAALLKRVILGTLQGSQSRGWLPWLLAEFEFRFNRRRTEKRPLLFARAIEFGLRAAGKTRRYFTEKGTMFREMGLT